MSNWHSIELLLVLKSGAFAFKDLAVSDVRRLMDDVRHHDSKSETEWLISEGREHES
jgi:hypothetical protein